MSLKYRDSQGNETPVAGLNGTSGELVPSIAAVRKGTFTVPPKPEAAISTDVVITFSTPMEDENYEVVFSTEPYWPEIILLAGDKTVNGFEAHIAYPINVPISYTINYTAFKLMTDEVHEADSTHIAQNTANFAPAFSEVTSYAVGDYVIYNNVLYRCTTAHTAGVWVAGHFTQVTVGEDLSASLEAEYTDLASYLSTGWSVREYVRGYKIGKMVIIDFGGLKRSSDTSAGRNQYIMQNLPYSIKNRAVVTLLSDEPSNSKKMTVYVVDNAGTIVPDLRANYPALSASDDNLYGQMIITLN